MTRKGAAMTGSQYKNIIQWTLCHGEIDSNGEALSVARKILNNLGVAIPCGGFDEIITALQSETYMGWRVSNREDAQRYANIGIAAIGIDSKRAFVILPDDEINNLSYDLALSKAENRNVMCSSELSSEEYSQLLYFVYSYGYGLDYLIND